MAATPNTSGSNLPNTWKLQVIPWVCRFKRTPGHSLRKNSFGSTTNYLRILKLQETTFQKSFPTHDTKKRVCQNRWPYHPKKILRQTPPCPPSPLPCANCQPLAGGNGRFCVQSLDGQGVSGCFDNLVTEAATGVNRWVGWVGLAVGWVDPGDAGGDARRNSRNWWC